jgi:hypothetical protein
VGSGKWAGRIQELKLTLDSSETLWDSSCFFPSACTTFEDHGSCY